MQWHFCGYVAQEIEKIAGEEFYKQYGQTIIDIMMRRCSENFEIVRYPEDEEILSVIAEYKKEVCV